jgi:hypothetical protein
MKPGNIWSGSPALARFTNPTALAVKKGTLDKNYPIHYNGKDWVDVEAAYKATVTPAMTLGQRMILLAEIMTIKFRTYPELIDELRAAGGEDWIFSCWHVVYGRSSWEGHGRNSMFLRCLAEVWRRCSR